MITLGSLFDGISGFPLAGQRNGIEAVWASEIEPFPLKVSAIRFPDMKQMGDITKIDCSSLELVDIITGGSPCQDLSVAGKRAGLAGERSGLFMEQVRIVREMRDADKHTGKTNKFIRPRFMVWENVPGAFSSNKGEDFRAVLEETARIADETASIPRPPKDKWNTSGCIMGNGYSIAWRILDAQYWGVPQRRRRIFLVADFGGNAAGEILFKRQGLRRHLAKGREEREGIAAVTEGSTGKTITLNMCSTKGEIDEDVSFSLMARMGTGGNNVHAVVIPIQDQATRYSGKHGEKQDGKGNGLGVGNPGDPCPTLTKGDKHAVAQINCQPSGIAGTVSSKWSKGSGGPAGDEHYNLVCFEPKMWRSNTDGVSETQLASQYKDPQIISNSYSVRRLTPLECERLQDYPDGWTDITWTVTNKKGKTQTVRAKDGPRYKAEGNSVAVCCPEYVLEGIKEAIGQ